VRLVYWRNLSSEPLRCVECGSRLTFGRRATWYTCSICGKPVCVDCARVHNAVCLALTWNMAKREGEEIVPVDKPHVFRM